MIRNKTRTNHEHILRHNVVYQYKCDQVGCNSFPDCIGYTSCTLTERFKMHTQTGSIKKHLREVLGKDKVTRAELLQATTVLKTCNIRKTLTMTEAMIIKELKPQRNCQEEGCHRLLKIFKH